MNALIFYASQFEGQSLNTILFHDRPCWIAQNVGNILGYAQRGKGLTDLIGGDWQEEFLKGQDYSVLSGHDLDDFKRLLEFEGGFDLPSQFASKARRVTLLFESGLHLACLKTNKPAGRKLRRFLAEQVLPQVARTMSTSSERTDPTFAGDGGEPMGLSHLAMLDRLVQSKIISTSQAHGMAQALLARKVEGADPTPGLDVVHFTGKVMPASWALFKLGPEYGFEGCSADFAHQYEDFIACRYPNKAIGGAKVVLRISPRIRPFKEPQWRYPESFHRMMLPEFLKTIPTRKENQA